MLNSIVTFWLTPPATFSRIRHFYKVLLLARTYFRTVGKMIKITSPLSMTYLWDTQGNPVKLSMKEHNDG